MQPAPDKRATQSQHDLLAAVQGVVIPSIREGAARGRLAAECRGSSTHFLFVLQGKVTLSVLQTAPLMAGAWCLLAAGSKPCEIDFGNGPNFSANSKMLWISPITGGGFCHISVFRNGEHLCPAPLFVADAHLSYLMHQVHEELLKRDLDYEALASTYLLAFFLRLNRALLLNSAIETQATPAVALSAGYLPQKRESVSLEVQRARAHIESNLQGHLTLISIAAHVHTSPSHLNRLFNLGLGTSVMKYVATRRIEAAKSLLIQTDLAVHVVGQLTGYPQHAHFTQTFTQHVKLAPQEYRKRYKIDHDGL